RISRMPYSFQGNRAIVEDGTIVGYDEVGITYKWPSVLSPSYWRERFDNSPSIKAQVSTAWDLIKAGYPWKPPVKAAYEQKAVDTGLMLPKYEAILSEQKEALITLVGGTRNKVIEAAPGAPVNNTRWLDMIMAAREDDEARGWDPRNGTGPKEQRVWNDKVEKQWNYTTAVWIKQQYRKNLRQYRHMATAFYGNSYPLDPDGKAIRGEGVEGVAAFAGCTICSDVPMHKIDGEVFGYVMARRAQAGDEGFGANDEFGLGQVAIVLIVIGVAVGLAGIAWAVAHGVQAYSQYQVAKAQQISIQQQLAAGAPAGKVVVPMSPGSGTQPVPPKLQTPT
ncbi:MAG: hypothetical protein QGI09_11330, partial [Dehalococcoidia bacterium]|nr:hypothetical protein [Dehalococcoidia bacterium]